MFDQPRLLHRHANLFPIILVLIFAGCGEPESPPDAVEELAEVQQDPAAGLPEQKQDTLYVEGQPEAVTLELFHDEALPAVTYLPEGEFDPEVVESSQATALHLVASFGGVRNEDAWMRLFFPAPHSALNDADQLQTLVTEPDGIADIEGFTLEERETGSPCPMASRMWMIRTEDDRTGFMCISSRGDSWFLAMAAYPLEYGDGFGPRAAVVLRELQWLNGRSDGDFSAE